MKSQQTDKSILIETADVTVPRVGTTDERRVGREAIRLSHPDLGARLDASNPLVEDDDDAVVEITYLINGDLSMGFSGTIPVADLPKYRVAAVSAVNIEHDPKDWYQFSFHLDAEFAFELLKKYDVIRSDSTLLNERYPNGMCLPHSYEGDLLQHIEDSDAADALCKKMEGM